MPELVTPEGAPVALSSPAPEVPQKSPDEINREFSRAMAAEDPSAVPAPPLRPQAPEGGQPVKRGRGRPRKNPEDKPRTEVAPAVAQKSDKDYTEEITGLVTGAWLLTASVPGAKPYAVVISDHQSGLIASLNAGAQHNAQIRGYIERMAAGGGGLWAVQLAMVGAQMGIQALTLSRSPEARRGAQERTETQLQKILNPADAEAADVPAAAG